MMKRKVFLNGILMLALLSLNTLVSAQPTEGLSPEGEGNIEERHERFMEKITEELGLSDEQQAQLKVMRKQSWEAHKTLKGQIRATHDAIKDELDCPESDRAVLDILADELTLLRRQMIDQRIDKVLDMKQVLTPEQYSVLSEKINKHKKQRSKRFKNHGKKHGRHHWKEWDNE